MQLQTRTFISVVLLLTAVAVAAVRRENVLPAPRVGAAPAVDGRLDDPVWEQAGQLLAKVHQPVSSSGVGDVEVRLRALHDGHRVYFAAQWPDPTWSVIKGRWLRTADGWRRDESQDEDRLALMFPGTHVEGFAEAGCRAACHGTHMRTPAYGQRLDVWHWKAARTSPLGYADDEWWDETPLQAASSGGRKSDSSDGGPSGPSANQAGEQPAMMPAAGGSPFLYRRDAIGFDDAKADDTVPGYILDRAIGSRADVDAVATWSDGVWTLELSRRLNTAHRDDVVFTPGSRHLFSVAVFENLTEELGHGNHGMAPGPFVLELGR